MTQILYFPFSGKYAICNPPQHAERNKSNKHLHNNKKQYAYIFLEWEKIKSSLYHYNNKEEKKQKAQSAGSLQLSVTSESALGAGELPFPEQLKSSDWTRQG